MPDAAGNHKGFSLTSKQARETYERIFPKRPALRFDSGMDAPPTFLGIDVAISDAVPQDQIIIVHLPTEES
jgi:hypothetical protein